jgi:hypothetical protein
VSPSAAARLIVETTAFFALHRHYDPYPTAIDDPIAEATVVDALINAYAMPEEGRTSSWESMRDTCYRG